MTMAETVALSSTKSPAQLEGLLNTLRRERAALKTTHRRAQRTGNVGLLLQTLATIGHVDGQIASIRDEMSRR